MVRRTALVLTLLLLPALGFAQTGESEEPSPSAPVEESEAIRQYEQRLRSMVNRFEQTRELLRQQIEENEALRRENSDLAQQLDAVSRQRDQIEGMSDDERVAALQGEVRELQLLNDSLTEKLKGRVEENRRLTARLKKAEAEQLEAQDEIVELVDLREEQKLLQVGAGFSPNGYMNGLFLVNIPETPLGLFAETNYRFREKEWSYSVGVQFRFAALTNLINLFSPE
ncbi:MAG: hypothetical protein ACOCWS_02160 [Alkalispirochaetaceae bacterium]